MTQDMDMSQYLGVFLDEADEQIGLMEQGILQLEQGGETLPVLQAIFRAAHTLKGSSRTMGFADIGDLTHRMENVLDRLRKEELAVAAPVVDLLFECLDALKELKYAIIEGKAHALSLSSLFARLEAFDGSSPGAEPVAEISPASISDQEPEETSGTDEFTFRIAITLASETLMKSVRVFIILQALEGLGNILQTDPSRQDLDNETFGERFEVVLETSTTEADLRQLLTGISEVKAVEIHPLTARLTVAPEAAAPSAQEESDMKGRPGRKTSQTIRVDVGRLDKLMNLVGELVIDRTRMVQLGMALSTKNEIDDLHASLAETASHIGQVTDELQEEIMKARMLPIEQVFNRFPRMVRDLAQKAGKEVHFVVEGRETELDRSVIEVIGDPLIHLLRNAIDHGIEKPEERLQAGKPETGTIRLSARHEENYIVIEVEDDGKGIDPAYIRASAVRKGMISSESAARLTDREAINLIFASGFSTARQVSDVSGRGVGMDIVKSNLQKLNGLIDIQSTAGVGTRFTVKLPLTLAIIRGLLVTVGEGVYAIPLTSVLEAIVVKYDQVHLINGCEVVLHREQSLPLLRLGKVFGSADARRHAKERSSTQKQELYVVVVGLAEKQIGLVVDSLLGEQEVVIKSLGRYLGEIRGISGATILGDGRVALIVDVGSLLNEVMTRQQQEGKEPSGGLPMAKVA